MKVLSVLVPLLFAMSVAADKRVRPFSFQRQTASSSEKPASESGPYPPSGWKPEKPQTSTESAPYPPSGWKPDGPQLEVGPPPKKPEEPNASSTPAPDSETSTQTAPSGTTSAPAKLVSFLRPQDTVYYVLPNGKLQRLVIAPHSGALLASAPYQHIDIPSPLQLQVVDSHLVQVEPVQPLQGPVYSYNGALVSVLKKP